jgi:DNA-binding NtrC family response regulator
VLETELPADVSSRKLSDLMKGAKKRFILEAVKQAGGNITRAAELLEVHPNHLHWLIRTLKLKPALEARLAPSLRPSPTAAGASVEAAA